MRYTVVFNYLDGEKFELDVAPGDMEDFMACLNNGQIYFSERRGAGVWIPLDKIRYFHVERLDIEGNRILMSDEELAEQRSE